VAGAFLFHLYKKFSFTCWKIKKKLLLLPRVVEKRTHMLGFDKASTVLKILKQHLPQ
jgi:hypothetical protein